MNYQYLTNEELQIFQNICIKNNTNLTKKYLNKYSSIIIINTVSSILRGKSSSDFINNVHRIVKKNNEFDLELCKNLLLAEHLDINQPSSLNGDTLLYSATIVNNFDMVKYLISKNADVNACNTNGSYPLISASIKSIRLPILEFLLAQGSNPNIITNSGDTCLTYCVKTNSPLSLLKLIQAGADINFLDSNNRSCLEHALNANFTENISVLCQSAKDQIQIDKFKNQAKNLQNSPSYDFTINVLNSIELKLNLDSTLPKSNTLKHKNHKI